MKVTAIIFIGLFLIGSSVGYAETHSSTKTIPMGVPPLEFWSAGDHLGAAKRYEEEARLLRSEARGMEYVEMRILPFLEVEAIKEAGVQKLIDRRLKEAEENMKLASWHRNEGIQLLAEKEASMPAVHSQKPAKTGVSQTPAVYTGQSYMKYDWITEEALLGW